MATAKQPIFRLIYEGQDITEDLTQFVLSISYTDNTEGESDEVQIVVDDTDGNWRGPWNPEKGDKLSLEIGYDDSLIPAGVFSVDEIELNGPPDTVNIRALATGISSPLRTKTSAAFEEQSLQDIAQKIADKNNLTVQGDIPDIQFIRVTQNRETDLAFLHRISKDFGIVFSVRDEALVFTDIFELEDGEAVTDIDRKDLISYRFTDKTITTYKDSTVSFANSFSNGLISFNFPAITPVRQKIYTWDYFLAQTAFYLAKLAPQTVENLYGPRAAQLFADTQGLIQDLTVKIKAGQATVTEAVAVTLQVEQNLKLERNAEFYTAMGFGNYVKDLQNARRFLERQAAKNPNAPVRTSPDTLEMRGTKRAETEQQAERMARSALHRANTKSKGGSIRLEGNPLLLAGSNFNLTGFGRYSSVCQILSSTHDLTKGSGYTTTVEFKVLDELTDDRQN